MPCPTLPELPKSACILTPQLALPCTPRISMDGSHIALHILACLDSLTASQEAGMTILEADTQVQSVAKVYTKEDFSVVNRFEGIDDIFRVFKKMKISVINVDHDYSENTDKGDDHDHYDGFLWSLWWLSYFIKLLVYNIRVISTKEFYEKLATMQLNNNCKNVEMFSKNLCMPCLRLFSFYALYIRISYSCKRFFILLVFGSLNLRGVKSME